MTFQQLHCLREVVAHKFNVSRTAGALFTTQPGISKLIRALETELGVEVFVRRGNRLVGLTEAGKEAYTLAGRILRDTQALRQLGAGGEGAEAEGVLRVGTTHIHARYHLLSPTDRFVAAHPKVRLEYSLGTPAEIYLKVRDGSLDFGVSTLPGATPPGLLAIPAYDIPRCLAVPDGHPLLDGRPITLDELARWPWVVHDERYTSGAVVSQVFQRHGLQPRVVMRASDVSIMKTYVARGIGIAVLQKIAMSDETDGRLREIDVSHLFPASTAMVTLREDYLLSAYALDYLAMILPHLTRAELLAQLGGESA
ncbi:hypothetical protein CAL29_03025 [Bordetella genomosp. 10]|uniref:HTH lysR-type domain-containing protein n=1 Tax=Bordetella genomosp. 10 TaxID=1416804 RepID=A0A261SMB8_9BORD|nr:hypothetical protein CAL29_03025 [Bordetella genomosp. 10]